MLPILSAEQETLRTGVLDRCAAFTEMQVWSIHSKLNPEAWLSNFRPEELLFATTLLRSFMYFNAGFIERMAYKAIGSASASILRGSNLNDDRASWDRFLKHAIFTRILGDPPSEADSGFTFQRIFGV